MIRVGRCQYVNGKRVDPHFEGYTPILVLTKCSAFGELGPYVLADETGAVMENIWQAAKVYERVPKSVQRYSRYDQKIIWNHPSEKHVLFSCPENPDAFQEVLDAWIATPRDERGNKYTFLSTRLTQLGLSLHVELLPAYWAWRHKLQATEYAVRYPVTFHHRHNCLYSFKEDPNKPLNYIEARKEIYLPVYAELVKRAPTFATLQRRVIGGENLLIIEVDGPHQESLPYYQAEYGMEAEFIQDSTMLATQENIAVMSNDPKHPFGHGYCLAMALLDKEKEWCV